MKNYAVLSGNIVVNIIVAKDLKSAELATNSTCIEYTNNAGIGWTYDGENFIKPELDNEAETV